MNEGKILMYTGARFNFPVVFDFYQLKESFLHLLIIIVIILLKKKIRIQFLLAYIILNGKNEGRAFYL